MSTAVLYSGQLRTFQQCYPTQRWQVFRHYPDLQFFFVVQKHPNSDRILEQIRSDYPDRVHVRLIDDPILEDIPDELGRHAPYANAAPHKNLLLQHWYQKQVFDYYLESVVSSSTIIRMRCDNWMHHFVPPEPGAGVIAPYWGRFGGMNDRMAIMSHDAANAYFYVYVVYPSLLKAGCPFHPESLLLATLESNGVRVNHTLNAVFGTLRTPRQVDGKWIQEMRPPEILPHEIAEYARNK